MADLASDVLVIGGGMAGTAIAAHLAAHLSVRLLEMEDQLGYHSTGRSAALFSETYGNSAIRALSRASRKLFFAPAGDFASVPLVRPRPVLIVARIGQEAATEAFAAASGGALQAIDAGAALALCPALRSDGLVSGLLDSGTADIEVHELQQGYLRQFRSRGGQLSMRSKVTGITRLGSSWAVECGATTFRADLVINAAGAWAGDVGYMAGAQAIGLEPRRRTAVLVDLPPGVDAEHWPMLLDVEEQFYAKPDAGLLLLSPGDETPTIACDASPDELDIAIAIDRLQNATTLEVRRVRSKWAGLRSFVADRSPVVGFDAVQPGFFWAAALGGYGIQTAPALSRVAASLALGQAIESEIADFGVRVADISPLRLVEAPAGLQ